MAVVETGISDAGLFITLNRPGALNCIDGEMADAMGALAARLPALAREVRVIVLRGAGPDFCAGGDLRAFQLADGRLPELANQILSGFHAFVQALVQTTRPVVGVVQGSVAGGGLSLALACDLLLAVDNARFAFAYRGIGASPDGGMTYMLPRLVGHRRAMQMLLLGGTLDAHEAQAEGLVCQVVPPDRLETQTADLVRRLSANATGASASVKALLAESGRTSLREQLALERAHFITNAATPDFAEGVDAFLGRRPPRFNRAGEAAS